MPNLAENSKSYHEEADVYERFSQAEDTPKKILNYLLPLVIDKNVLDLGCGSGKYLALAPFTRKYTGLDVSFDQLKIARQKAKNASNVEFICSSAEKINLPNESQDIIIAAWVIGTILDEDRRTKVVLEAQRILKKQGNIYLVENDIGGDFEQIRGRYPNITETKKYNDWLEKNGFTPINRFETHFEFDSLDEARNVFSSIWDQEAAKRIKNKRISHNIAIYTKTNTSP